MIVSEKIETIDNKVEQNICQHDLDRQTAKISALSSGNISEHEFLTGKDILSENDLLKKVRTIKRFEYSPLDKELQSTKWYCKETIPRIRQSFMSRKDN